MRRIAPGASPVFIADGTLEALKWLAAALMTLDHVNKYLLDASVPALFNLGRLAMPLFVFVLAYNLARPRVLTSPLPWRICKRLTISGLIASAPFGGLGQLPAGWYPLNIMFALLVATAMIGLWSRADRLARIGAVAVFVFGGALVEYWWPLLILTYAAWLYCKKPTWLRLTWFAVSLVLLWLINQNFWALAALPLMLTAPRVVLDIPRLPRFFYAYYPTHLAMIWALVAMA